MFVALQIPLGALTEPLPLRYFDVILTAVPAPFAVNEAPPTFKYLFVLVIFIAEEAVKFTCAELTRDPPYNAKVTCIPHKAGNGWNAKPMSKMA